MNFELKEIGITLLLGAFTILGCEAVLRNLANISIITSLRRRVRSVFAASAYKEENEDVLQKSKKGTTANRDVILETTGTELTIGVFVFLGLSFLFGLFAEDLSYKYEDSKQMPFKTPASWVVTILSGPIQKDLGLTPVLSRYHSRIFPLVGDLANNPEITPLAKDLANSGVFQVVDEKYGAQVGEWLLDENRRQLTSCDRKEKNNTKECSFNDIYQDDVEASITTLYYFSKNEVYQNPNYYDEMKKIQSRLEFSRSISMISFLYMPIVLIIILFWAVRTLMDYLLRKTAKMKIYWLILPFSFLSKILLPASFFQAMKDKIAGTTIKKYFRGVLVTIAIFFAFYFFGLWAYQREAEAYNKRAFGYFSSMLIKDQSQSESDTVIMSQSRIFSLDNFNKLVIGISYGDIDIQPKKFIKNKDVQTVTYLWKDSQAHLTLVFENGKLSQKSQAGLK